jgi:hypothetical protein
MARRGARRLLCWRLGTSPASFETIRGELGAPLHRLGEGPGGRAGGVGDDGFDDEPIEWMRSRQITRVAHDDPRGPHNAQQCGRA